MSVLRSGVIFLSVMYSADISASAADAITVLMICAIVNTVLLSFGLVSFSERNICAPARLLDFYSLRKPASVCAANIISLFRKVYHHQGRWPHNPGVVQLHFLFPRLLLLVGRQLRSRILGFFF